jgi:hypothetical protein
MACLKYFLALAVISLSLQARAQFTEPLGGQPPATEKPSVADLDAQVAYQRAFEAVIWSMPAVAIYRMRAGAFENLGISDNGILAYSQPCSPRCELLTANNATPYVGAYSDLRKGPVVLEVPAKTAKGVLYGQIVDAWQTAIADVGPSGADKGEGGKYLLLPPGYQGPIPAGYLPIQSPSNRVAFAFRSIRLGGASNADAYAYARKLRMYYLAEAQNPPPQTFANPDAMRYPTLPFYDERYFDDLSAIISAEPVQERDKVMMGMLASIGIEPGKPFSPSPETRSAEKRAVVDAWFYLQQRAAARARDNVFWPGRHWSSLLIPDPNGGFKYVTDTSILLDDRGVQFFVGTYYPKVLDDHASTMYLAPFADKAGAALEAGKTYRFHFPADMPVQQFWSLTVYDQATWAFIYTKEMLAGLSSFDEGRLKANADGSVDLYIGPKAPEGMQSNWIPTAGKRPYPVVRFYGPTRAFWDKSFVMPDIEEVG